MVDPDSPNRVIGGLLIMLGLALCGTLTLAVAVAAVVAVGHSLFGAG